MGGCASAAGEGPSPRSLEDLEALLAQCAAAGRPPMVVANPDFVTTSGADLVTMPGHLGRIYVKLGGRVPLSQHFAAVTPAGAPPLQLTSCGNAGADAAGGLQGHTQLSRRLC